MDRDAKVNLSGCSTMGDNMGVDYIIVPYYLLPCL